MPHDNLVDQDSDAEMNNAQPVFKYIKPPRLTALGQPALVKFMNNHR
ncbi:hypothetical protein L917_12791 [Phytophthora nicotianae]|nr:hypothetical protein L917_12791 [Phytophthora nicotianae]